MKGEFSIKMMLCLILPFAYQSKDLSQLKPEMQVRINDDLSADVFFSLQRVNFTIVGAHLVRGTEKILFQCCEFDDYLTVNIPRSQLFKGDLVLLYLLINSEWKNFPYIYLQDPNTLKAELLENYSHSIAKKFLCLY